MPGRSRILMVPPAHLVGEKQGLRAILLFRVKWDDQRIRLNFTATRYSIGKMTDLVVA